MKMFAGKLILITGLLLCADGAFAQEPIREEYLPLARTPYFGRGRKRRPASPAGAASLKKLSVIITLDLVIIAYLCKDITNSL